MTMHLLTTTLATPAGPFTLLVGDEGVCAAGEACARNNAALFVPCHRVLRSDGSLGGYVWGTQRKRWLLTHESALLTLL